jgi:hypothetical protein
MSEHLHMNKLNQQFFCVFILFEMHEVRGIFKLEFYKLMFDGFFVLTTHQECSGLFMNIPTQQILKKN